MDKIVRERSSTYIAICDKYIAFFVTVTLKMIKKYEYLIFPAHIKRFMLKGDPIQFCIKTCIGKSCNKSPEQLRGVRHYDLRLHHINLYLNLHLCPDQTIPVTRVSNRYAEVQESY